MPRGPRVELAGGTHHVTARAPSGRWLFRREEDWRVYLALLDVEAVKRGWVVLAYCLMGNHVHVLLRTPEANLGVGMKCVHQAFARYVNRSYSEHGHVFGDRFANKLVRTDAHLLGCLRYIARNPVAAGLCEQAGDWPWSSHAAVAGDAAAPRFLAVGAVLAELDDDPAAGRAAYRRLVGSGDRETLRELAARHPAEWVAVAVDDYAVPVPVVASFLGLGRSATYARLASARESRAHVRAAMAVAAADDADGRRTPAARPVPADGGGPKPRRRPPSTPRRPSGAP